MTGQPRCQVNGCSIWTRPPFRRVSRVGMKRVTRGSLVQRVGEVISVVIGGNVGNLDLNHGSRASPFVERTFAWLNQFRRLRVRYDKRGDIHEAFLSLGWALICWHSLRKGWMTG